ncbi:S1 family peptidase [Micromonospora sp. NBC_01655]|uniref:trypsin-like serine protease n=1 Tax=Micromonospora sp. NBC_01655 TaxID=2975983 RepID=UPI00224DD251|nr:trypsin-like serine protease [Micromonospora sp. NBC_01655]MCX4470091.1 S1 family peptidase [Micromonospora sp. NBC_01655]
MRTRRMIILGVAAACAVGTTAYGLAPADGVTTRPVAAAAPDEPVTAARGPAAPTTATGLGAAPGARATSAATTTSAAGSARVPAGRPAAEVAAAAPASVAYLRDRYGISATDAARRLALQELSASLAATLADRLPGEYGGMWLDQSAGGVLTVAATRPESVRAAVAAVPDAAHVRVVPVRHSLRQLTASAARIAEALDATVGADVVVDQAANEVVVLTGGRVASDDRRLPAALADAGVSARARVARASVPKACDPRDCTRAPMRGGIRLDIPRDDGTVGGCTTGFNVQDRYGAAYVLTAGHCVVGGRHTRRDDTWHQFLGPKIPVTIESGNTALAENAYPHDYAVMPYQSGALQRWGYPTTATSRPSLVNYWCVADNPRCTTSRDVAITGYVPWSGIQTGWVVCATGSAYTPKAGEPYVDSGAGAGYLPGTRCGQVTGKSGGGIDVRICARPGDSGGPLFTESDGKALGILSSGDPGQGPCANPDEHNSYAPVSTILDRVNARANGRLGLRLATTGPVFGPVKR